MVSSPVDRRDHPPLAVLWLFTDLGGLTEEEATPTPASPDAAPPADARALAPPPDVGVDAGPRIEADAAADAGCGHAFCDDFEQGSLTGWTLSSAVGMGAAVPSLGIATGAATTGTSSVLVETNPPRFGARAVAGRAITVPPGAGLRCAIDVRVESLGGGATSILSMFAAGEQFDSDVQLDAYAAGFSSIVQTYSDGRPMRSGDGLGLSIGNWVTYTVTLERSPQARFRSRTGSTRDASISWTGRRRRPSRSCSDSTTCTRTVRRQRPCASTPCAATCSDAQRATRMPRTRRSPRATP